jgi:hypothetical protein
MSPSQQHDITSHLGLASPSARRSAAQLSRRGASRRPRLRDLVPIRLPGSTRRPALA